MPLTELEATLSLNSSLIGLCSEEKNAIWVLRGNKQFRILLHELCHWFICFFKKSNKIHKWFDKCFTVQRIFRDRELEQIRTRPKRYKNIDIKGNIYYFPDK